MSQFYEPASLAGEIQKLQRRIDELERSQGQVPVYTAATRPAASAMPYRLIRNSTTGTLQWSDGATWA